MPAVQQYDTTILDRDIANAAARFLVIPRRSIRHPEILGNFPDAAGAVGLQRLLDIPSAILLPFALLSVLRNVEVDSALEEASALFTRRSLLGVIGNDYSPRLLGFAEYISYERLIPFEQSPLIPDSLASIFAQAKYAGVGFGGYAAFSAFQHTPLILIAVPTGMVIGGAAWGIGVALQNGLQQLIETRLMGLPSHEDDPTKPSIEAPPTAT